MTAPSPPARYGVFGNPIAHSLSPRIHTRFAELTGQHLQYDRHLAPLDGFANSARAFFADGGRGCNITVPFKLDAAALADETSERVQLAGACNTLALREDGRLYGENTDGLGLMADLTRNAGWTLAGRSVLLIGAGGASAGVLGPLLAQTPAEVWLVNRTATKAEELAARHQSVARRHAVALHAGGLDDARLSHAFDFVINASASSLNGSASPVPPDVLGPHSAVVDLMYGPAAQGFLTWAAIHGARTRDGLGMLVEQAAEAFALWRGVRPPTEVVLTELRAEVQAKAAS